MSPVILCNPSTQKKSKNNQHRKAQNIKNVHRHPVSNPVQIAVNDSNEEHASPLDDDLKLAEYLTVSTDKLNLLFKFFPHSMFKDWEFASGIDVPAPIPDKIFLNIPECIWICMKHLIARMPSYSDDNEIIALLATLMLLYADRSATSTNKWRMHLNGALELLRARNNLTTDLPGSADTLFEMFLIWFSIAETYAWLSSPNGGTVHIDIANEIVDDTPYAYLIDGLLV